MKSLARIRKRQGRCYELAMRALQNDPAAANAKLVHGTVLDHRGRRIGHAWLLLKKGGVCMVYDPVLNGYSLRSTYINRHAAVFERVYTQNEAAKALLEAKHFGPWHEPSTEQE